MRLRRVRRLVIGSGVIAMLAVGAWGLWPMASVDHDTLSFVPPELPDGATEEEKDADALTPRFDPDIFRTVRLWNPPPEPVQPQAKEQEVVVKRPELELIGIIEEEGRYLAALYDLDRDEIRIVALGDRIEPFQVAAITAEGVRLEDGRYVARLAIRDENEGRSP